MPSVVVTYNEQAGHSYVTMAGTISTDEQFATQPIVGDQVVYPDTLSVSATLDVTGPPGDYTLWHIIASTGNAVATNYGIAGSSTATYNPQSGYSVVTLSGTIPNDAYFTVQPVAGDQIVYPDALTVTTGLVISGASGNYTLWHITQDGTAYNINYFLGDQVGAGSATYTAGPDYTTATLDSGFDAYIFEGWSPQPVAGEQITTRTADGYFTSNGDYITELEHVHDAWFTALDGTITHFTVDSQLQAGADTTPDSFGFNTIIGQPLDTLVESSSVQLVGFDSGLDVPISCSAGDFYATSTDNINWSAWTNTPGFIQLNAYVKLRHRSSNTNETTTTATLTVGGVTSSPAFSVTTANALITSPNQFTFTDTFDAPVSTVTESNPVTIFGMSHGVKAAVSVQGGEWAKSSDSGVTYTAFTTSAGTATNGDLIKVRTTSNATPDGFVDVILTVATVSDTWRLYSEAPDLIPNQFTFTDIVGASVSTVYESSAVMILGISSGFTVSVSVTNGDYAISTDSGATWGDFTSADGSVSLNDQIKLRRTSSANSEGSVSTSLTVGGVSDTWTINNIAIVDNVTFWSQSILKENVLTNDNFGYKDFQSTRLFWINLDDVVNNFTVLSFVIDPSSTLSGITIESAGINAAQVSDIEGNTYAANTLIGVSISGGVKGETYIIPIQFTLSSGETGERNLVLNVVDF